MSGNDGPEDDHFGASDFVTFAAVERLPSVDLMPPRLLDAVAPGVELPRPSSLLRASESVGRWTEGPKSDGAVLFVAPVPAVALPPDFMVVERKDFAELGGDCALPGPFAVHRFADLGVEDDVFPLDAGGVNPSDFALERVLGTNPLG